VPPPIAGPFRPRPVIVRVQQKVAQHSNSPSSLTQILLNGQEIRGNNRRNRDNLQQLDRLANSLYIPTSIIPDVSHISINPEFLNWEIANAIATKQPAQNIDIDTKDSEDVTFNQPIRHYPNPFEVFIPLLDLLNNDVYYLDFMDQICNNCEVLHFAYKKMVFI